MMATRHKVLMLPLKVMAMQADLNSSASMVAWRTWQAALQSRVAASMVGVFR